MRADAGDRQPDDLRRARDAARPEPAHLPDAHQQRHRARLHAAGRERQTSTASSPRTRTPGRPLATPTTTATTASWNAEITRLREAGRPGAVQHLAGRRRTTRPSATSSVSRPPRTARSGSSSSSTSSSALIHARLGELVQNIATMGRITANMAASSAGEKLLLREAKLRRRDGYTNRGQPSRVLNRLP